MGVSPFLTGRWVRGCRQEKQTKNNCPLFLKKGNPNEEPLEAKGRREKVATVADRMIVQCSFWTHWLLSK